MQLVITFITVVAGLVFSVAVAVIVEEFIFGQIFKMFFAPAKPVAARAAVPSWVVQPVRMDSAAQR